MAPYARPKPPPKVSHFLVAPNKPLNLKINSQSSLVTFMRGQCNVTYTSNTAHRLF